MSQARSALPSPRGVASTTTAAEDEAGAYDIGDDGDTLGALQQQRRDRGRGIAREGVEDGARSREPRVLDRLGLTGLR